MRRRPVLLRRLAPAVLAAIAVALPLVLTGTPAEAGYVPTVITSSSPVTWVDAEGRQLMIATSSNASLTIARDTVAGDPDTTWGAYGFRTVAFTLPAGAATTSIRVAPDGEGRLTLVHGAADCTGALPCDRWFQQIDGSTGATVTGPTLVEDLPPTYRALDDGSLLVGAPGTALAWYGHDGAERRLLPVLEPDVVHTDVDAAGRLLVLTTDGTVHRYPAGEGPALEVDTPCDAISAPPAYAAVGASSVAPGFAVACAIGGGRATALRYADDGALSWSQPGTAPGAPDGSVTDATVTADGRVWVATLALSWFPFLPNAEGSVRVTPASPAGWQAVAYHRITGVTNYAEMGGGVAELRPVGDGNEVAVADLRVCCRFANNTSAQMAALSAIVPYRPGPPLSLPGAPVFARSAGGDLTVSFPGAPWSPLRANRKPTGYRVEVSTSGGTTATGTAPDNGSAAATSATLPGFGSGEVVHATITPFNGSGDGVAGARTGTTVTPFGTATDFVDHQARTLAGSPLAADDLTSYVDAVTAGDLTPGAFMEEMIAADGAPSTSIEPTARIYRAAFLRDADIGGLRYWVGKHRTGTRIATMAEQFARSSEFQRRYGTLTNRRFVERIYQNVLGRPGDAAGVSFWTARLDGRRATRGAVLAGFSESGEFIRRTRGAVQPLTVTFLMLDRRPTASEAATWSTAEAVYADMPEAILATNEYAARLEAP